MKLWIEDGGDGSTYVCVERDDGRRTLLNPDLPYEGGVLFEIDPDGTFTETVVHTSEQWEEIGP